MLFNIPEAQKLFVRFDDQDDVDRFSSRLGVDVSLLSEITYPTMNRKLGKAAAKQTSQRDVSWKAHWVNLPEYEQERLLPHKMLVVYLDDDETVRSRLAEVLEQRITSKTKSVWYPELQRGKHSHLRWVDRSGEQPKYPVYVISKGRPTTCITSRELDKMGVDHRVVVEQSEYEQYVDSIGGDKLLVLPFSNLGQGSIPARNWVWSHSIAEGHDWHWILDDNIEAFYRMLKNRIIRLEGTAGFRAVERLVSCYDNVAQAGLNYEKFCKYTDPVPAITLNTRVYSCILLRNDLPFRWRGRYNEDTDLSLRILKSGLCTMLVNAFLAGKVTTQRMKGGNTDQVYVDGDDRKLFAESLRDQHPDVVRVTRKFNRWHHHVDYSSFKANKPNRIVPAVDGVDEMGLHLEG